MKYYSYVVSRDFGFAPNPFGPYCTLATCKQQIRKNANINDWIFGLTPKYRNNNLLYAMQIEKKITFNEYWNSKLYQYKKPVMNGSLMQMYGDNIYFLDEATQRWFQANSHHSLENGKIQRKTLDDDVGGKFVLISENFYYFGSKSIEIPNNIKRNFVVGRNYRYVNPESANKLIKILTKNNQRGYNAEPTSFTKFQRYKKR
jgi:hypothetical protein